MPEQETLERIYQTCYQPLTMLAERLLKDNEEARDVVSDVFTQLADGSIRLPQEKPESYLAVAVRNRCLDHIRRLTTREKFERHLSLQEPSLLPVETEQEQLKEIISYAERTMSAATWRVFRLRFDEGLTFSEIGRRTGTSEVSAYKRIARALEKLKEKYNPTIR